MDSKIIQIIESLNQNFKKSFIDFRGAYLYGSQVKGTSHSDSDIVAVFDAVDRNKRMDIWGIVGKLEAEFEVFIDLHPMTKEELEKNPIYYNQVVNNGVFYAAA